MYLLWTDCEMTGLNFKTDKLLEIACILTKIDNIDKVLFQYHSYFKQNKKNTDKMNNICKNMHTNSGLINKVLSSKATYKKVENEILNLIVSHVPTDEKIYIAGNSVYTDLVFIKNSLPILFQRIHYRIFDISTLKLIANTKNIPSFKKEKKHEASSDIHESIAEYKYYQKVLLKNNE